MDQWEQLRQRVRMSCRACGLADTRTNVVFGVGSPTAEVLLVGEAPGASEDQQGGSPLWEAAGKTAGRYAGQSACGGRNLHHQQRQVPPAPKEPGPPEHGKDACSGYLRRQLELMQPKILVPGPHQRGGDHQAGLQDHPGARAVFEKNGMWMMALYHPAALLRDGEKAGDL